MALVSKNIPNLINGISQQPAALRLDSQGEEQENGFSDVVEGLKKRPPSQFIKKLVYVLNTWSASSPALTTNNTQPLSPTELATAFFHTYKRSGEEQYTVVVLPLSSPAKVIVYDVGGNLRYQSGKASFYANGAYINNSENSDSTLYFQNSANSNLTATSVADATFIVNKTKTVSMDTSLAPTSTGFSSLVYLKSINYGRDYQVTIKRKSNNSQVSRTKSTPQSITSTTSNSQTINSNQLKVSNVISYVRDITSSTSGLTREPTSYNDEPFFIVKADATYGDFDIDVTDDDGGVNFKAFKDVAKSFTDLPNQCIDGFRLGVVGDNQKKEDDFHVVYVGGAGSGYWKETVKANQQNNFNLATMPHQIRQNANLSFTFGQGTWNERKAGDDNTNPAPSFVGGKINDIFFHRNRLGILSDENVIFSEASGYYNFWRTTVRTLLDSDPIDVAVSQNEVSELKAAIPIQDNLLLFSELNQFTLSASQLLTPSEITIDQSTKFQCDLTASPVGAGTSVFFATTSGQYAGVREFYTVSDTEVKDAVSITSHVPQYLDGNIRAMTASSNEDMLVALTSTNKKECYVYKWYNQGQERLQSSWSKWVFDTDIAHVAFNNATLNIIFADGRFERLDTSPSLPVIGSVTHPHPVLLDHLVIFEGDTNFDANDLVGYGLTHATQYVTKEGVLLDTTPSGGSPNTVNVVNYLAASASNYVFAGIGYNFKYKLSEQIFKPEKGDSTKLSRLQLRKLLVNYSDTGHFKVTVDSSGRPSKATTFTGRIVGQANNTLNSIGIVKEGYQEVGVQSQAEQTAITIENNTHLPCIFQSAEWEGFITLRNTRI